MNMTEVDEKYSKETVVFSSYYKYSFNYRCTTKDGNKLLCWFGGDSESIYRHEVAADEAVPFECVQSWHGVTVVSPEGQTLFEWYD